MKEETALIVVSSAALPAFAFANQAAELKEAALQSSALIGRVTNADENSKAVGAQSALKDMLRLVERQRKKLKEPLLEAGRELDRQVAAWVTELEQEEGRISNLVTQFAEAEARRVREEEELQRRRLAEIERQRNEELRRLQAEQEAKERAAREAQAAAERAAREAKTAIDREAAKHAAEQAEQQRLAAERAAAESKQREQAIEDQAAAKMYAESRPVQPTREEGQIISYDWAITVTNPWELARCCPDCVKIEPLLTPIKTRLNAGASVPGVKAEKITKANVRSKKTPLAIDV